MLSAPEEECVEEGCHVGLIRRKDEGGGVNSGAVEGQVTGAEDGTG